MLPTTSVAYLQYCYIAYLLIKYGLEAVAKIVRRCVFILGSSWLERMCLLRIRKDNGKGGRMSAVFVVMKIWNNEFIYCKLLYHKFLQWQEHLILKFSCSNRTGSFDFPVSEKEKYFKNEKDNIYVTLLVCNCAKCFW